LSLLSTSSVSNPATRRAWSGFVTMFWPSMMSPDPPPVTPRRKLPPLFGAPLAVGPEVVADVPSSLLHAASAPLNAKPPARYPPPIRIWRRVNRTSLSSSSREPDLSATVPPLAFPVHRCRGRPARRRPSGEATTGELGHRP